MRCQGRALSQSSCISGVCFLRRRVDETRQPFVPSCAIMYMWWISSIAFLCFLSPVFLKGELGLVGRAQDKLCQGTRRSSCGKNIVGDWNRLVDLSKTWLIDEPAFESKSQLLSVTYITIVAKFVIDPWIEQFLVLVQPNLARYISVTLNSTNENFFEIHGPWSLTK